MLLSDHAAPSDSTKDVAHPASSPKHVLDGMRGNWRTLFFCGIALTIIVFFLNHAAGLIVNGGDYTPFSVDPRISAVVYDETQLYAPGPSRLFYSSRLLAELD